MSLSSVRTEFEILCKELGGPAPLDDRVERSTFTPACDDFRLTTVWPLIEKWKVGKDTTRRYWPWIALAAQQYRYERKAKKAYDPLKKCQIEALIPRIHKHADLLVKDLCKLKKLSNRLRESHAPMRRDHLAGIDEYLSQNLVDPSSSEVDKGPAALVQSFETWEHFLKLLINLVAASQVVQEEIDESLLKGSKPQNDPALHNLVWRAVEIWEGLTGRVASVNKSMKKNGEIRPDFVLFVIDIAKLAADHEPTYSQILTAFRTCYRAGKKTR